MADAGELMDRGLMKRLLAGSKNEPVACAVALAADGKSALMLLDKIKQGMALQKELVKAEPDAKNPRFGTAFVDADDDPKLVKLVLNKAAPGIAKRLVKSLKGTGYNKVEIYDGEGHALESAGGQEEDETAGETITEAPGAPAGAGETDAPPPGIDSDKVRQLIVGLLPQVQSFAGDAAVRIELVANLQKANTLLKANAPEDALKAAREVAKLLAGAATKQEQSGAPAINLSPVKLGKASLLWRGMWSKADKELQVLRESVLGVMMSDPDVDPENYTEIETNIDTVAKITERLNLALADELDSLRNVTADKAAAPLQQLEKRLGEYENYLQTDEWVTLLDNNEFHPVTVQADLLKAVRVIREALKP